MKKKLSVILLILYVNLFSQENLKVTELPRFSIRANIGIPKVVSSKALRNSFSGVVSPDINVTTYLFSHYFIGVGYNYTYFQAQKYFRDQSVNTNMQMQNGYLKVGYDKFVTNSAFTTVSLNMGYGSSKYQGIVYKSDSLIGKSPTSFSSAFIEPQLGINFLVEPNFGFGGFVSYHYNFSSFNPAYPGFDKWLNYSNLSNKWNASMITLGFGFYYGIGKQK